MKRLLVGALAAGAGLAVLPGPVSARAAAFACLGVAAWGAWKGRERLSVSALLALCVLALAFPTGVSAVTLAGGILLALGVVALLWLALGAESAHPIAASKVAILLGALMLGIYALWHAPFLAPFLQGPFANASLSLLLVAAGLLLLGAFGPVSPRRNADKGDGA